MLLCFQATLPFHHKPHEQLVWDKGKKKCETEFKKRKRKNKQPNHFTLSDSIIYHQKKKKKKSHNPLSIIQCLKIHVSFVVDV